MRVSLGVVMNILVAWSAKRFDRAARILIANDFIAGMMNLQPIGSTAYIAEVPSPRRPFSYV